MSKFHYEPGEREQSVTSPGKKKQEDFPDKIVLTLSNYAVKSYELKPEQKAALGELFRNLFLGRSCATHALSSAEGYSDAVDDEALNTKLRESRAVYAATLIEELCKQVDPQFKPSAESRAAPAGKYLNPSNDTAAARADNRAVRMELKRLPQDLFFTVRQHPDAFNKQKETCGVVDAWIWERGDLEFGGLTIRGRKLWADRAEPIWANEVIYYNTHAKPLAQFLNQMIVVHHTSNNDSLRENEQKQQKKGYAALGYHFAIAKDGRIFQGRPLQVMGSHAGEGLTPGPTNDPDWGAVGIVMLGDFDGTVFYDDPTSAMLDTLEKLVRALVNWTGCKVLAMHKEVIRKGDPTVCPGNRMYDHVEALRKKLGMSAPAAPATPATP